MPPKASGSAAVATTGPDVGRIAGTAADDEEKQPTAAAGARRTEEKTANDATVRTEAVKRVKAIAALVRPAPKPSAGF